MHIELHNNEELLIRQRKHWFIFFSEAIGFAIAAIVPFIIVPLLDRWFPQIYALLGTQATIAIELFLTSAWLLLIWIIFCIAFTNYYLDVLVITSRRLIDIDQLGLFARDIATIPFENIQDIKIDTVGILATLLGYGNLHIQTAGHHKELIIRGIKDPENIKNKILGIYHNITVIEKD